MDVPRRSSQQQPLFSVDMFLPQPFEPGSLYEVLAKYSDIVIQRSDFPAADPSLGGNTGWCPVLLSKLVLLQRHHGWTDRETVDRASVDMRVKACLGLGLEQKGPSQSTLSRHRQWMQTLGLADRYMTRLQETLQALELVSSNEPVSVDSVPIEGAGQQLDSYNLLAGAVRNGLQALAKAQGRPSAEIAAELELSAYLGRSIKGRFDVDWQDDASRNAFLSQLVADAHRVRNLLAEHAEDCKEGDNGANEAPIDRIVEARDTIDKVIGHDVEFDDHGKVEGIRQRAGGDRRISLTDPDMRHGRKSASQLIAGYKAQIVATVLYGFILLATVIKANRHDGQDLPALVQELDEQGFTPIWWAGDHAYGTLANHRYFQDDGRGELVAPMPRPVNGGRFPKDEFDYDFERHTLTCPRGLTVIQSRWATRDQRRGRLYEFPGQECATCPLREQCVSPNAAAERGRTVFIMDEDERLIREHLQRRQQPEFRARLAERVHVERVIAGFAQSGGKRAHRFGQDDVSFDAKLSALTYNLRRLGSLMRKDPQLQARVEEQAFRLFLFWLQLLHHCRRCAPSPRGWLLFVMGAHARQLSSARG